MKQKGFTLIELLVVIAIIGLLASVVLVALNGARQKARVAKRLADIKQIYTALELYANDNNGQYPIATGGNWHSMCPGWIVTTSDQVIPGLVPKYLSSFPSDPSFISGTQANCYMYYSPDGVNYKFMEYLLNDMTAADVLKTSFADPVRNGGGLDGCAAGNTTVSLAIWSTPAAACGY